MSDMQAVAAASLVRRVMSAVCCGALLGFVAFKGWVWAGVPDLGWRGAIAAVATGGLVGAYLSIAHQSPRFEAGSSVPMERAARPRISAGFTASEVGPCSIPLPVRRELALHEAAHAIAAAAFGERIAEIRVDRTCRPDGGFSGYVRTATWLLPDRPTEHTVERWWSALIIALAGPAMDHHRGRAGWPSIADMDTAHRIAEVLFRYRVTLPNAFKYGDEEDLFTHALSVAATFVAENETQIAALAQDLIEQTDLHGLDVLDAERSAELLAKYTLDEWRVRGGGTPVSEHSEKWRQDEQC